MTSSFRFVFLAIVINSFIVLEAIVCPKSLAIFNSTAKYFSKDQPGSCTGKLCVVHFQWGASPSVHLQWSRSDDVLYLREQCMSEGECSAFFCARHARRLPTCQLTQTYPSDAEGNRRHTNGRGTPAVVCACNTTGCTGADGWPPQARLEHTRLPGPRERRAMIIAARRRLNCPLTYAEFDLLGNLLDKSQLPSRCSNGNSCELIFTLSFFDYPAPERSGPLAVKMILMYNNTITVKQKCGEQDRVTSSEDTPKRRECSVRAGTTVHPQLTDWDMSFKQLYCKCANAGCGDRLLYQVSDALEREIQLAGLPDLESRRQLMTRARQANATTDIPLTDTPHATQTTAAPKSSQADVTVAFLPSTSMEARGGTIQPIISTIALLSIVSRRLIVRM